jgi:hypothetical protein
MVYKKPPTIHQATTEWSKLVHGVAFNGKGLGHAATTLCGRLVGEVKQKAFVPHGDDPAGEGSCQRCTRTYNKNIGGK